MRAEVMTLGTPNPRQREFLACEKKYVAFGGARGGGKSWAVRCKAKLLALRYAGIRILLVRRSLAELEANHLAFLRQELADVAEYRAGERQFRFCNGSVLQFGYCGCDRDLDRYQGDAPDSGAPAPTAPPPPGTCPDPAGRQRCPPAGRSPRRSTASR